jgi:hypothetical protein
MTPPFAVTCFNPWDCTQCRNRPQNATNWSSLLENYNPYHDPKKHGIELSYDTTLYPIIYATRKRVANQTSLADLSPPLNRFSGDPASWESFNGAFQTHLGHLPTALKYTYLKALLKGPAAEATTHIECYDALHRHFAPPKWSLRPEVTAALEAMKTKRQISVPAAPVTPNPNVPSGSTSLMPTTPGQTISRPQPLGYPLPKFGKTGGLTWRVFLTIWELMVDQTNLSNQHKLCLLKTSLRGSAIQLIMHLNDYPQAISLLKTAYTPRFSTWPPRPITPEYDPYARNDSPPGPGYGGSTHRI